MKNLLLFVTLLVTTISISQDCIVDKSTGVQIYFFAEENIFPKHWYIERVSPKATSLDTSEYIRSEQIVKAALKKYPVDLIKTNLKKVYVLNDLSFYGQSFGGTYSDSIVYLTNEGLSLGFIDGYIERVFHAELSSILLENYKSKFNEKAWSLNNPVDFSYGASGVDALKNKESSEDFTPMLNKMGFITQYGMSTLENDFNSFVKNLFMPRAGFADLIDEYPNLSYKINLIKQFYRSLDESFTEAYFNELLRPKATAESIKE
jgi:hypothetical protein